MKTKHVKRDEMIRKGAILPFSDEWKRYVADAIATPLHLRTQTMQDAIKLAINEEI